MKTSIIPIFIPHIGCPHRCVFCNQWKITGHSRLPEADEIRDMIRTYTSGTSDERHWEIAFYGGSFTAIDGTLQERLLQPAQEALQGGLVQSIRCSTRPDCIDRTVMDRLYRYGLSIVELGVQSMDDDVLRKAQRGHTAQHVQDATAQLRRDGFVVGHQLMPGLPGEDWASLEATTAAIIAMKPDMARIYPVVVIDGTELADEYRQGTYEALSVHEGVRRAAYMKAAFLKAGIPCIRTGLQATDLLNDPSQVLAGAYAPAMGEMVDTQRWRQALFSLLKQVPPGPVTISYNRCDTSRLRGLRNSTVKRTALAFAHTCTWQEDHTVQAGTIGLWTGQGAYMIDVDQQKTIKCHSDGMFLYK